MWPQSRARPSVGQKYQNGRRIPRRTRGVGLLARSTGVGISVADTVRSGVTFVSLAAWSGMMNELESVGVTSTPWGGWLDGPQPNKGNVFLAQSPPN